MLDDETISYQENLLRVYRTNIRHLLMQAAQYGGESSAPLHLINSLDEARTHIQQIKEILRANNVVVSDDPDDTRIVAFHPSFLLQERNQTGKGRIGFSWITIAILGILIIMIAMFLRSSKSLNDVPILDYSHINPLVMPE